MNSSNTTTLGIHIFYDIPYNDGHERHFGDLFLPPNTAQAPIALIIHGGGWRSMDKNSFAGVAEFFALQGYAAFAINYRLLGHAAYPACFEDCLAATEFISQTDHELFQDLDRSSMVVCGGSAGGHLALMTGLCCESIPIKGIVSIAGPTDMHMQLAKGKFSEIGFFDSPKPYSFDLLEQASPLHYVNKDSAPLLCTHSTIDELVEHEQAEKIIKRYQELGLNGQLHSYLGNDKFHGIWPPGFGGSVDGPDGRITDNLKHLHPELEAVIADFLQSLD